MLKYFSCCLLTIVIACKNEYKKCDCISNDHELQAYNEVLNKLVENHFYNFYLGEDEEKIFKDYVKNPEDTLRINKETVRLQNQLFNDTSKFCTLYFDTLLQSGFYMRPDWEKGTDSFSIKIKKVLNEFSNNKSIFDSLNKIQSNYTEQDFKLCTYKLKSIKVSEKDNPKCIIGKVAFSRIFFNETKDKGLLYYEFGCEGLCGKSELIIIELKNDHWLIRENIFLSVS